MKLEFGLENRVRRVVPAVRVIQLLDVLQFPVAIVSSAFVQVLGYSSVAIKVQ